MSRKYFGTDGVRGPYGGTLINEDFAWRLGAAAGRFAKERKSAAGTRIFIGRDTRASGVALEKALAGGLQSEGFTVVSLGIVPTPVVSLMTREGGAALGVVITASHNPARDNGVKFFDFNGIKLTDAEEERIEAYLPPAAGNGTVGYPLMEAPLARYLERTTSILPPHGLSGWKVVLDTANGAASVSSGRVLEALGASLVLVGTHPDGKNINEGVGSQHPEKMAEKVRATGARIGVAHDGDADRCVLCDETGEILDGDEILTVLALHALRRDKLVRRTLVVTVQSNLGVDAAISAAGGRVLRTQVGDRYVMDRMLAEGATLGGESSGHIICAEISSTGDGLVAALKIIQVMIETGRPLSELRRGLTRYPQSTNALRVCEKKPLDSLHRLNAEIKAVEEELGSAGRVLVRYSGTEPKLRLLVEGPNDAIVQSSMERLVAAAHAELDIVRS